MMIQKSALRGLLLRKPAEPAVRKSATADFLAMSNPAAASTPIGKPGSVVLGARKSLLESGDPIRGMDQKLRVTPPFSPLCQSAKKGKKHKKINHNGGEGGIRTHGRVSPTAVFKTAALNHSATSPNR